MRDEAPHCHSLALVRRVVNRALYALALKPFKFPPHETYRLRRIRSRVAVHDLEVYARTFGQSNANGAIFSPACGHD